MLMDRVCHPLVMVCVFVDEKSAFSPQPAVRIGREPAGDHQGDTAAGPFGIKRGKSRQAFDTLFFEASMHRTHQHAVGQRLAANF